jgi:hypothetical protein
MTGGGAIATDEGAMLPLGETLCRVNPMSA